MLLVFCALLLNFRFSIASLESHDIKTVKILNEENFDEFISHSRMRLVVFHEKTPDGEQQSNIEEDFEPIREKHFIPLYEKSAKYVATFGIKVGIVDCTKTPKVGKCGKNVDDNIRFAYGYKKKKSALKLAFENLFDDHTMIGSLLHLNIISEIPVINKEEKMERRVMKPNKGKKDVLFGYFQFLGDEPHRLFVEEAYSYLDDFAYVIFTDRESFEKTSFFEPLQLEENAKLMIFQCKEAKENELCPRVIYKGGFSKENITAYFLNLKEADRTFDIPRDGGLDMLEDMSIHKGYLFYDKASKESVKEVAEIIRKTFPGELGVFTVDTGRVDTKRGLGLDIKPPAFALKSFEEKKILRMNHRFTEDNVINFVDTSLHQHREKSKAAEPFKKADGDETKMDDEVAAPVHSLGLLPKTKIQTSHITALTDESFPKVTGGDGPTLVVFYTTYDSVSMALLRSYTETAIFEKDMTSLTRVDCFDWTDVCTRQKVFSFPTVRVYVKGRPISYHGILDGAAIIRFRKLIELGTPLELTSPEKAKKYMSGSFPDGLSDMEMEVSIAVGLTSKNDIPVVKQLAEQFSHELFFAYGTGDAAKILCGGVEPSCVVFLFRNEPNRTLKVTPGKLDIKQLTDDIRKYRLQTVTELTVTSLPKIYDQKKPIVLYFGDPMDAQLKTVADVKGTGEFNDYLFSWVNSVDVDSIGGKILQTYVPDAHIPALALVNLPKGQVHMFDKAEFTVANIKDWTKRVADGKEVPKYVMPETKWKPLSEGYDFIELAKNKSRITSGGRRSGAKKEGKDSVPIKVDEDSEPMKTMPTMMDKDVEHTTHAHEEL